MPTLLSQLASAARKRELLAPNADLDPATVFALVRDMPYQRASDRQPATILREWCGTCSGKHYLLKALFTELGYTARVMACSVRMDLSERAMPAPLGEILAPVNGRFVDIHNYLILDTPQGEMTIDATWPLAMRRAGFVANDQFILGQNQQLAYPCDETWVVPDDVDPQAFKTRLLTTLFTADELAARDAFIETISQMANQT